MKGKYDDIMDLPHHVSGRYRHMSRENRAAQFAPFAALTGYEDAVEETARLTDAQAEITEERREWLDTCLNLLEKNIRQRPEVTVTYFQPDHRKAGGAYVTMTGTLRRVDAVQRLLVFADGRTVDLDSVYHLRGGLLPEELR